MSVVVTVACPHCSELFVMAYVKLGAPGPCPSCGEGGVAEIPEGATIPAGDDEMCYRDFMQLVSGEAYRGVVGPYLWTRGLGAGEPGPTTTLSRADGTTVDALEAHLEIQGDPKSRREIYQIAMGLWR